LNHLWQRFLLTCALIVGVFVGIAVTVFGFDNVARVNVHWLVFNLNGVPVWAVAVVPLALVLIAGTLYHWADGLHHFTEHMRHRRRVHELEAEVASLRAHLDQLLEMPDHTTGKAIEQKAIPASLPPAEERATDIDPLEAEPLPEEPTVPPVVSVDNSTRKPRSQRKRIALDREMIEPDKATAPSGDLEPEA